MRAPGKGEQNSLIQFSFIFGFICAKTKLSLRRVYNKVVVTYNEGWSLL